MAKPEPYKGWKKIDNEPYHNGPGYSSSDLRLVLKSPAHYKSKDAYEETDSQLEGSAAHSLVLDTSREFNDQFRIIDGTRTAKMKQEAKEDGISLLSSKQGDNINAWAQAIKEHDQAVGLLSFDGPTEISGFWTDPDTGLQLKIRPDKLISSMNMIVDLKFMTTQGSVDLGYKFQAAVVNYRYDIQAALYLQGANAIDRDKHYDTFIWIVCVKEPPYMVGCYVATQEILVEGQFGVARALETIKECETTGLWPKPFTGEINQLTWPHWFKSKKGETIYE